MDKLAILGGEPVVTQPFPRWPYFDEKEEQAVLEVLRSGNWWQFSFTQAVDLADSEEVPPSAVGKFQRAFARAHDCVYGIGVANGTVSLEIALRAAGVKPGDEVILPAYTFVATSTAPLMIGAIPVFVDIEADTYCMDVRRVEEAITDRTRAIMPVHFGGQPCDMEAINQLAKKNGLVVIEDAAHAHGSSYNGKKCGSLADMASFSFQGSKNMTAGEGGIITTNHREYAELAESIVWAGRKRNEPWYRHYELGGNARMTEFEAAILLVQLSRLEEQTKIRMANAHLLDTLLEKVDGLQPMTFRLATTSHAYHLYMIRYDPKKFAGLDKNRFTEALRVEGVEGASGGYVQPLYANPLFIEKKFYGGGFPVNVFEHGRQLDYADFIERCPVSERACSSEAIWLPQNVLLGKPEAMQQIAEAVKKVQRNASQL